MPVTDSLLVSVVVPAYNAAAQLPMCVSALCGQDFPAADFEIIVADDGSMDDSAAVAERSGASLVLRLPHGDAAAARNAGIAAARGEIILFTDADCEPFPNWITEMTRPFADPQIVGVKGAYRTRQQTVIARLAQCEFEERYDRLAREPFVDFVDTYAAGFRASVLRQAGGFDASLVGNEDVDLAYRLARQGHKLVFNRSALVYHEHRSSWVRYLRLKFAHSYWRTIIYRTHPGKALRDSYTPQLLKFQVLLMAVSTLCAVTGLFWRPARRAGGTGFAVLVCSAYPFTRLVARLDAPLARWAPIFVVARAAAFAVGVAIGGLRALFSPPSPELAGGRPHRE